MPVAVDMTFVGGTLDQYDQVISKMGYAPAGTGHPKALFHFVTAEPDGLHVIDVWTTAEAFQEFGEAIMGPITAEVGVPEPKIEIKPIHNYLYGPDLANL